MPLIPQDQVVQFLTGAIDTSTAGSLVNATKVAMDVYTGHLTGAITLHDALGLLDALAASGQNAYFGFSEDNLAWHETPTVADQYIRFNSGQTRPPESDTSWSVGIRIVGQGIQGAYYVRQYINAAFSSA